MEKVLEILILYTCESEIRKPNGLGHVQANKKLEKNKKEKSQ